LVFSPGAYQVTAIIGSWLPWGRDLGRQQERRARLRRIRADVGMYIACRLNFLEAQASVALDPDAAIEHRAYASSEISDTLARLPMPSLISHLISLAVTTLG
jgi:hypothetical protein